MIFFSSGFYLANQSFGPFTGSISKIVWDKPHQIARHSKCTEFLTLSFHSSKCENSVVWSISNIEYVWKFRNFIRLCVTVWCENRLLMTFDTLKYRFYQWTKVGHIVLEHPFIFGSDVNRRRASRFYESWYFCHFLFFFVSVSIFRCFA